MRPFYLVIKVSPRKIFTIIKSVILAVILTGISISFIIQKYPSALLQKIFHPDAEANIPTYISVINLLIAAGITGLIAGYKRMGRDKFFWQWRLLTFIFLLLSLDEMVSLHEHITYFVFHSLLKNTKPSQISWAMAGMGIVVLFLIVFARFILHLPTPSKMRFILAGFVYILGALGFEFIGGAVLQNYSDKSFLYYISSSFEEALEMTGVYLFIRSLFYYISENLLSSTTIFREQPENEQV